MECYYCNANADVFGGIKCVIGCKPYHLKKGGIGCCYNYATVAKRMKERLKKHNTNYDRIVSKTPEELAKFMGELPCCPPGTDVKELCYPMDSCEGTDLRDQCWLDWLKQEATE